MVTRRRVSKRQRSERAKELGAIVAGGIVEVIVESLIDVAMPAQPVLFQSYNVADFIGALESLTLGFAGLGMDNKYVTLIGAGGLAVAVPNLVWKVFRAIGAPLPIETIRSQSQPFYSTQGKYGRNIALPPQTFIAMRYPHR